MKSKKVLILSDLWGFRKHPQIEETYRSHLPPYWKVSFHDSSILADLDAKHQTENELHYHFITGGVNTAVNKLIHQGEDFDHIIGLSIGGLIGWKYALAIDVNSLTCISSTRLRKEHSRPKCQLHLYYGDHDNYAPSRDWLDQMKPSTANTINGGHDIYTRHDVIKTVCNKLIQ